VAKEENISGQLWIGASALAPASPFIGETYICQVTFQVAYQPVMPDPAMGCALALVDTKMGRSDASPIAHTAYDGAYTINAAPISTPSLYIDPDYVKSTDDYTEFSVDVAISGLLPQWDLYGWEAKVYYNGSVIDFAGAVEGPFLPSFEGVNGTFFLVVPQVDYVHLAGLFLGDRTPPSGSGVLATLTFNCTDLPLSPDVEWSDLILSDVKLGAIDLSLIPLDSVTDGYYEGYIITGRNIDVVTEHERWPGYWTPYIGEGPGECADAYAPQENVTIFANLTYNLAPIAAKAVAFEIRSPYGDIVFTRQTVTDLDGMANMTFRIPWPDIDPESIVFGTWTVLAKASVAEVSVNDTVCFEVGWIVSGCPTLITPDPVVRGSTVTIDFDATNIGMIDRDVYASIVVYDELGVPVGAGAISIVVPPGTSSYSIDVFIPTWAYVGTATAILNLFTGVPPSECGVCYGPECSMTFGIIFT
jgi:hypothetical protein